MRKPIIQTFFATLTLLLVNVQAWSLPVPAGKAAVIEAVIGKVSVNSGGKEQKASVGMALAFGDLLNTGSNGRVSLRHADNAVSRLAPNTDLTLVAPDKSKGVFLSLGKGLIRFLVGKRAPGEVFEVRTRAAVAAVKGTDAEVETDGTHTRSSVYSSDHDKALSFEDLKSGKSIDLSPGESSDLGENGFEKRDLDPADFKDSDQKFKGLPPPVVDEHRNDDKKGDDADERKKRELDKKEQEKKEQLKREQEKKEQLKRDEEKKDEKAGLDKDAAAKEAAAKEAAQKEAEEKLASLREINDVIKDVVADVMKDISLDQTLERDERTGDLVAGRVAIDRNGDRAQISSYIQRTDAATIVKSTYTKRDSGPYKGLSSAEEATSWNLKLPDDWASVANRKLSDKANLDKGGNPIYYLTEQHFKASNETGDSMAVDKKFQQPFFSAVDDGKGGKIAGALLPQGYSQDLVLNGKSVLYIEWLADYSLYKGTGLNIADAPTKPTTGAWGSGVTLTKGGSILISYDDTKGTKIFSTDVAILTNEGKVVDPAKLLGKPQFLRDFRGLDTALNLELTFSSQYLKAPIDLMVIPAIFDTMDFFDVPLTNS